MDNACSEKVAEQLLMVTGSVYIPKEKDEKPSGDDAHFICAQEQTIGLFDGVGGWSKKGVDAGEYARELMTNCVMAIHEKPKEERVDPTKVLSIAYSNTSLQGSSTACIISLSGNMCAVNVGDSGFMVIRNNVVLFRSPIQQKRFNCPYQLGLENDNPSSAQELCVQVQPGDVVVAGTDGVFDNVHTFDILNMVSTGKNQGQESEGMAWIIANAALYNSFDRFAHSPYAEAARLCGNQHTGGKVDDITVVVAFIVPVISV